MTIKGRRLLRPKHYTTEDHYKDFQERQAQQQKTHAVNQKLTDASIDFVNRMKTKIPAHTGYLTAEALKKLKQKLKKWYLWNHDYGKAKNPFTKY